jgi:hypothetical protein
METNPQPPVAETTTSSKKTIVIAVSVVAVIAAAYAAQQYFFSPERVGEYVMERALEQAGDGAYDVDMRSDGSVSVVGTDGETYTMTSGTDGTVTLPADWPAELALPASAALTYAATVGSPQTGAILTVTHTTTMSPAETAAWYRDVLVQAGWKIELETAATDGALVTATKAAGDRTQGFMATVSASEAGSDVGLTFSSGQP